MLELDLKIDGLKEANSFLGNMPVALKAALVRTMLGIAGELRSEVQSRTPVGKGKKAGALRDSIRANVIEERKGVRLQVTAGNSVAFYARWVESGHFIVRNKQGRAVSLAKHRMWRGYKALGLQRGAYRPEAAAGFGRVEAKPYMEPAVLAMQSRIEERITQAILEAGDA